MSKGHPRSSRGRYRRFVEDYKLHRLDLVNEQDRAGTSPAADKPEPDKKARGIKRRQYLREYLRWLWPQRYAVGAVFILALVAGGLEMAQPLFMRFIVDRVLLRPGLDVSSRLWRLEGAGAFFLAVIIVSNLIGASKDYRQRLLNSR